MGIEFIKRPLWVSKLSDEKLRQYIDALNEFELRGGTDNELLLDTADTWYDNTVGTEGLMRLSIDVYKEATRRWYEREVY